MRTLALGMLSLMMGLGIGTAQVVRFPDPNLETAVREALGKPTGDIIAADMAALTHLGAGGRGIVSIEGLEYAVNLTHLDIGGNEISDITVLASLPKLFGLTLWNNRIADLSPLAALTNLGGVLLAHNQITDISALVQNSDAGGLGQGDFVNLQFNYLDLRPGSRALQDIQALVDRGVTVAYEPQNAPPPAHTVSAPSTPSGPSSGQVGASLGFSTGGATCSQGHSVQYQFDWGDGTTYSSWSSGGTASHSYAAAGTYPVRARARCSQNTSIISDWSSAKSITISTAPAAHTVSSPTTLSGPSSGQVGAALQFSTGGSSCSQGHSLQYQFEWGATANRSVWSSQNSASHAFTAASTFQVRARARCSQDTSLVSEWSSAHTVTISPAATVVEGLVVTVADKRHVRRLPGINGDIITTLRQGSPLEVLTHVDNGKWVDGYQWWHVKFGVLRGWIAGADTQGRWFIAQFDPADAEFTTRANTYHTAYIVALEAELHGDRTQVTNPPDVQGTFFKAFLYSARGICMQGSGQAEDRRTVRLVSGDGRWVNSSGQEVCYDKTLGRYVLCGTHSPSAPHWVKEESAQRFGTLPEGVFQGSYGRVSPWHTIAVDRSRIPLGSVVYIPGLAGRVVGGEVINGYFHAVDVGGAIQAGQTYDARIDVFVGAGQASMVDWGNFTGSVQFVDATKWPIEAATLFSPGELRVYDTEGRMTGTVDGRTVCEVPDSMCRADWSEVIIVFPEDSFRYVVAGTETGRYSLLVEKERGSSSHAFLARDVRTAHGAVHRYTVDWQALARGERGVTVEIDQDGDGVFEKTIQAGSEFTGDELEYTITATAGAGGVIAPSGSVAVIHGTDQTFTITPDSSHVIHDVFVDGRSVLGQVVMDGRVASYTFVNVTGDHTIHAVFAAVSPGAKINHGPNPVPAEGCVFWFKLPEGAKSAKLLVYNVAGRLVAEIPLDPATARYPAAGRWSPVDKRGVPLANGPYAYVLVADGRVIGQGKMVVQR